MRSPLPLIALLSSLLLHLLPLLYYWQQQTTSPQHPLTKLSISTSSTEPLSPQKQNNPSYDRSVTEALSAPQRHTRQFDFKPEEPQHAIPLTLRFITEEELARQEELQTERAEAAKTEAHKRALEELSQECYPPELVAQGKGRSALLLVSTDPPDVSLERSSGIPKLDQCALSLMELMLNDPNERQLIEQQAPKAKGEGGYLIPAHF